MAQDDALRARMAATIEHKLSPDTTFSPRNVLWWALGAAFQGWLAVVPQFVAMGRRGSANNHELRLRRRLLAEAEAAEAQATHAEMTLGNVVLPRAAQAAPRGPRTNATP